MAPPPPNLSSRRRCIFWRRRRIYFSGALNFFLYRCASKLENI
jgi:hypothetical protein